MSQITVIPIGSTPQIPTSFTPDVGVTVIPSENNVNFLQDVGLITYTALADQGVETISLFPSDDRDTLRVGLLGNLTRTVTTIGPGVTILAQIQLNNSPQVVYFYGNTIATSDDFGGVGVAFSFSACALTNGTIVDLVGVSINDVHTDPELVLATFTLTTTGTDNFLYWVVDGGSGVVLSWRTTIYYRFVA